MNDRLDAVVTETHTRAAIAGLRALGQSGLRVAAVGPGPHAAGLWSRYASKRVTGPDVLRDSGGFAASVGRVATERGPLVVYPVQEEAIDALFDAALPREAILPYPGPDVVRRLRDKRALPQVFAEADFHTPATLAEGTASELLSVSLSCPCVVKPVGKGGAIGTARVLSSEADLHELLKALPPDEPLVVQEHLTGPMGSIAVVVARDGRLVARFQHVVERVTRLGTTIAARSVAPDDRLAERVSALLAGIGYYGLAQLDFFYRSHGPAFIDVNPRYYGSMPLALACGVNLPAAWQSVVVDGPRVSPASYRLGVTYRWLEADVIAAIQGSLPCLLHRTPAPRVGDMWTSRDPVTGLVYGSQVVPKRLWRRVRGDRATVQR